jgi:general L-amino acid transport system permease protein
MPTSRLLRSLLAQTALALLIVAGCAWLGGNLTDNLQKRNISTGFDFLDQPAGFAIGESDLNYTPADTIRRALVVGLINTLKVAALAIALSTALGFLLGFARSAEHPMIRGLSRGYVEIVRNVPLLLQLMFVYAAILNLLPAYDPALAAGQLVIITNRGLAMPGIESLLPFALDLPQPGAFNVEGGWQLSAELLTLVVGLSLYTTAYVAEIVRAGLGSVPLGQREAALAVGLSPQQLLWRITLPQAMRAIIPPFTSWQLNTVKNSSLAIAIGYPDLVSVVDTVINQTGQAIEGVLLIVGTYLTINLAISGLLSVYNRRLVARGMATAGQLASGAEADGTGWQGALLGSPLRSALSLLLLAIVTWVGWYLVDWLLVSAKFVGDEGDCRMTSGACWPFLAENWQRIVFGTYPPDQQWRGGLALLCFVAALSLSFVRALWDLRIIAIWLGMLLMMTLLLAGGGALPVVPSDKWSGLPLTLLLASTAVVCAFPLATLLALGRRSSLALISTACMLFIEITRGIPLVGVLFLAAVMFPLFMPPGAELSGLLRVQVALTLFTAAYMAEAIRGGLQAVPEGQREAALALGLGWGATTRYVLLPQAMRTSLPGLVSTAISEVKNTTMVLIVGLFDLLQTTRLALVNVEWRPYFLEAYMFAGAIFFVLCFTISQLSLRLERSYYHGKS